LRTEIAGAPTPKRGKVRDIYDLGQKLLIVVTDRISAFDVVLPNAIPDKGKVLNQISAFWFNQTQMLVPNHVISTEVADFPEPFARHAATLAKRSMLVKKAKTFPVECIVRGYLAGSGWKDYQKTGTVSGTVLPKNLVEFSRLDAPIFTPSTKAETGHDENITIAQMENLIGKDVARKIIDASLAVYNFGRKYAEARGIIIADTKFEFGLDRDGIVIIDEMLTPDSSRFWPMDGYQPGVSPQSFDKQFVRDYLLQLDWDKTPPGPILPVEIVNRTREKYLEAFERLTGSPLEA
jgi:phosphoribosylaminoimidazole-succinocarboxamide synthase